MKVLVTDYAWPDLEIEQVVLGEIGIELVDAPDGEEDTLADLAGGVSGIMTCWAPTTRRVIESSPNCKVVSRMGIGLDNIDVDTCNELGIPVTNVPDYCLIEVAEHAIASILTLGRNLHDFHSKSKQGVYSRDAITPLKRLEGRTVGIVGLGHIGKTVVRKARALGFNVLGTRNDLSKPVDGCDVVALEQLLSHSDFITLHLPLTDTNHHMISDKEFGLMKDGSFLINTARGGLVDHEALGRALDSGKVAGAALDVQDPEPPDLSQPLMQNPRVLISPHAAFVSEESLIDLRIRATQNAIGVMTGQNVSNIVNKGCF